MTGRRLILALALTNMAFGVSLLVLLWLEVSGRAA